MGHRNVLATTFETKLIEHHNHLLKLFAELNGNQCWSFIKMPKGETRHIFSYKRRFVVSYTAQLQVATCDQDTSENFHVTYASSCLLRLTENFLDIVCC